LRERNPRKIPAGIMQCSQAAATLPPAAMPEKTSYWLSDAKEMAAIKTILIIVNRRGL
jgi:hypothetical protein